MQKYACCSNRKKDKEAIERTSRKINSCRSVLVAIEKKDKEPVKRTSRNINSCRSILVAIE